MRFVGYSFSRPPRAARTAPRGHPRQRARPGNPGFEPSKTWKDLENYDETLEKCGKCEKNKQTNKQTNKQAVFGIKAKALVYLDDPASFFKCR